MLGFNDLTESLYLARPTADVKDFSSSEMSRCNTALNNAIRKIFGFHQWESIRTLRSGLGYPDLYTIFAQRRSAFHSRLANSSNSVLRHLYQLLLISGD